MEHSPSYTAFGLPQTHQMRQRQPYSMVIYIYIYIIIHRQICFVLSELISVARQYLPVAGIETRLIETPIQASNHLATRRN